MKFCHHHDHPGQRTHILEVPDVHSNKSIEKVLNHVSLQPKSISRIHPSFFTAHQVTNNSKLKVSFNTRSKKCRKSLWKLALNNNNHHNQPIKKIDQQQTMSNNLKALQSQWEDFKRNHFVLSVNMSKAFDTVSRGKCLEILIDHLDEDEHRMVRYYIVSAKT